MCIMASHYLQPASTSKTFKIIPTFCICGMSVPCPRPFKIYHFLPERYLKITPKMKKQAKKNPVSKSGCQAAWQHPGSYQETASVRVAANFWTATARSNLMRTWNNDGEKNKTGTEMSQNMIEPRDRIFHFEPTFRGHFTVLNSAAVNTYLRQV